MTLPIELPAELLNFLTSAGGQVIAMGTVFAGCVRFLIWWKDRRAQAHVDSAEYFVKQDAEEWQQSFGKQYLARFHFARMTGIDRETGHRAIWLCHERMGGKDLDWERLRKAGRYLLASGCIARVRKLHGSDARRALLIVLGGMLSFALATLLLVAVVVFGKQASWHPPQLEIAVGVLTGVAYVAMFSLAGWAAMVETTRYLSALGLNKNRRTAAKKRRLEILSRQPNPAPDAATPRTEDLISEAAGLSTQPDLRPATLTNNSD